MATKKKSTKGNSGGRTANSEPKLQVFTQFNGCNFELSPRDMGFFNVDHIDPSDSDQTDLQMNYVVIQDNLALTSNKTLETRNRIKKLYSLGDGLDFTGVAASVGRGIFAAVSTKEKPGDLLYYINAKTLQDYQIGFATSHPWENSWTSFGIVGDDFIALCDEQIPATGQKGLMYWAPLTANFPEDAQNLKLIRPTYIPDPPALTWNENLAEVNFEVSETKEKECQFRSVFYYCYVSKLGPTKGSPGFTIYTSRSAQEISTAASIDFKGTAPDAAVAVEFFMTADDSMEPTFVGRVDTSTNKNWKWSFTGFTGIDASEILANSTLPEENLTCGPDAKYHNIVDGRVYFWRDDNRIYIGGIPGNTLNVSPGVGGGYVDIAPTEDVMVRFVDKYKTQSGNNIVTVLCDSKRSSREQRFNLVKDSQTLDNVFETQGYSPEQVAGAVGCKSPFGALVCEDGLYSVSRYGLALTTMTMEYNSQIKANYISGPISPVFTDKKGVDLSNAILFEANGILYLTFGKKESDNEEDIGNYESIIFCYDIANKAWWSYSLPISEPILNMIHLDYEDSQEGIAILTNKNIFFLPLTEDDSPTDKYDDGSQVMLMTGELSTKQPMQAYQYLSQIEYHFDYLLGNLDITVEGIDIFGRKIKVEKHIDYNETQYNLTEYMRIDLKLQSYKITMRGKVRMRLTHWISKVYTMSNKIGLVWGFDDRMSHNANGDIHPTFTYYNDIKKAIIP